MKNLFPDDEKSIKVGKSFAHLYNIIRSLRGPNGCPWDKEQTAKSLRNALLEEAYEAVEAITSNDAEHSKEELGDILLILMLISYIEEQEQAFSVDDMIDGLSKKLVRRHPHVFADAIAETSAKVVSQWEKIKSSEEGKKRPTLFVSKHLSSMDQSYKLQVKAAEKGFDWQHPSEVIAKVREELLEVEEVLQKMHKDSDEQQKEYLEEELGDLLFAVINLSRTLGIHPVHALVQANSKFVKRFSYVEEEMKKNNQEMNGGNLERMEKFWQKSKHSI